jgi:uncharacterized membrane protein YfcA
VDGVAKVAVGLFSGVLSGAFGIGGGLITTPAIRLLLAYPALIAVGTPLPVILPGALTGAVTYWNRGSADVRAGIVMGLIGSVRSCGAPISRKNSGKTTSSRPWKRPSRPFMNPLTPEASRRSVRSSSPVV